VGRKKRSWRERLCRDPLLRILIFVRRLYSTPASLSLDSEDRRVNRLGVKPRGTRLVSSVENHHLDARALAESRDHLVLAGSSQYPIDHSSPDGFSRDDLLSMTFSRVGGGTTI
jgi:hypothetical protein